MNYRLTGLHANFPSQPASEVARVQKQAEAAGIRIAGVTWDDGVQHVVYWPTATTSSGAAKATLGQ